MHRDRAQLLSHFFNRIYIHIVFIFILNYIFNTLGYFPVFGAVRC